VEALGPEHDDAGRFLPGFLFALGSAAQDPDGDSGKLRALPSLGS